MESAQLTGVVRAVGILLVSSHFLGLFLSVANADEVAVGDALQTVAGSADLGVHLVAAADGCSIIRRHGTVVRPRVLGWVEDVAIGVCGLGSGHKSSTTSGGSSSKLAEDPG